MRIVVQKFGGTSVASTERIKKIIGFVKKELILGNKVVVVVSAMSGITNQLISYCRDVNKLKSKDSLSEYDAVVHTGEIVTSGLLSLALNESGIKSISLNSRQIPIITNDSFSNALIENINPEKIIEKIKAGYVPVIPGFQGVSIGGRITTLGRGGSDITGAAIAAALKAFRVDIYTDVNGVYTIDPRLCENAKIIEEINYEQMLEISIAGSKVIHPRAVEIGMRYDIPMRVISSFDNHDNENNKYTHINNKIIMESSRVLSIGYSKNIFAVELEASYQEKNQEFINEILEKEIVIEYLFENKGKTIILINIHEISILQELMNKANVECTLGYNFGTISIVGFGLCNNPHIAKSVLKSLSLHKIELLHMSCLSSKLCCIVRGDEIELCTKTLHDKIF